MEMVNKMRSLVRSSRGALIGSLYASIILLLVVLVPVVPKYVATGVFFVPFTYSYLEPIQYVVPGVVGLLFAGVIGLLFYLLRIKHSFFVAGLGLAIGYVLFSWLKLITDFSVYVQATLFLLIGFALLVSLILATKRLKIPTAVSIAVFLILIVSSVYAAQFIETKIEAQRAPLARQAYEDAQQQKFVTARQTVNFSVYYPTYNSAELPASEPLLNGYSQEYARHTNPHVTFKLGQARVTQAALLKGQEKLMDFTRNCDILHVSQIMDSRPEVTQVEIDNSLENLSRCKIVHRTPTGTDVYYLALGEGALFYIQEKGTNMVIQFDGSGREKYSDVLVSEINKIIDSLQPIANEKLQRGNETRADHY
jgi:hypothetical protein